VARATGRALLLTAFLGLGALPGHGGEPAIVIDGLFDDWRYGSAVLDPAETAGTDVDLRRIQFRSDAAAIYLLLEYETEILQQGLDGTAMLLLDADNNAATGATEHGVSGVDLVVEFSPPDPRWKTGSRGVALRSVGTPGGPAGERLTTYELGMIGAPTHASKRFELRLERGHSLPGTAELFADTGVRGRFVYLTPDGETGDRSGLFEFTLSAGQAEVLEIVTETDPLARAPGTDFRLLSWNVSAEAIFRERDRFRRIFAAVQPDILLFDEAPATATAEAVLALVDHLPVPEGHAWQTVIGPGGGRQHAVVTSHHPVSIQPTLERVGYPETFPAYLEGIGRPRSQQDLRNAATDGVSTAGMVVEIDGRRLLAMPLDLQCCGRTEEPEDQIREIQAQAIRNALRAAVPEADLDGLIVAGDLNLVGNRRPLDLLTEGLDLDGSDLASANALQLDGYSNATWGFRGAFPASRLDYVFFGDSTLEALNAFVFDARDLDAHWRGVHAVEAEDVRASGHLPVVVDMRWRPDGPYTLLGALTLEEKASLITGRSSWETQPIARLGIPAAWMTDGPVGLRKSTGQADPANEPATCFPSASAMAATWNPDLIEQVGAGIGAEAAAHRVSLLLAPGLNIKRHPLGGRNFEYYSEDPLLSGRTAAAFVRGVQSRGVGATLKHFAVNNQEYRRMVIDARVDERTLREIYLRGFEIAVRESRPAAVMTAYNRINGTAASESHELLTAILRGEWGFDGLVVSDWGAVDDIAAALAAGLDLEMPGNPLSPAHVVEAVRSGALEEAALDRAAEAILRLAERQREIEASPQADYSQPNHSLAREVAIESMVLLQNSGILPLDPSRGAIGIVGRLAFAPRIQGIGSSGMNPTRLDEPWTHLKQLGQADGYELDAWQVTYAESALTEPQQVDLDAFLTAQDQVVVFAGQPASHDAEAWDRPSMDLAAADLQIIDRVRSAGKPFTVVLTGGGAIDVRPFRDDAGAILMGWLGGQAFGSAVAQVLYGYSIPSGKLSETFALAVDDHASAINFPGGPWTVDYGEGQSVGYRYFQSFDREVAYPFGHGLSYATFEYLEARAPRELEDLSSGVEVSVEVRNTGDRPAAETVQVYLRHLYPTLPRPDRVLVGFQKLLLAAGEIATYSIHIEPERFAYFHDGHDRWVIEAGDYELLVGASAADTRTVLPLRLLSGDLPREVFTLDHTLGDLYRDPRGRVVVDALLTMQGRSPLSQVAEHDFDASIVRNLAFRKVANFSGGAITRQALEQLLALINSDRTPQEIGQILLQMSAGPDG